ncbi:hypothetical protein PVK06_026623 [Gossypium arboreum]|uniref:Reverse transcriptase n=1 Tax=Gossypium arboreum TaxID=29729 RepID=A0ABR0NY92_GOSAR|nr:hypothetical protein PVK06_026623 [Gossypium arboreum]
MGWEFINASLLAADVQEFLRKATMSVISSSTIQVLWNGILTQKFKPVRGIKQGSVLYHPTVLCLEWLSFSSFSHIDCDMGQAQTLKYVLQGFYKYLGHKISTRKRNIFFSKGVDVCLSSQISELLGFQKVQNLETYLGVPLLHDSVNKSTLNFVVEKFPVVGPLVSHIPMHANLDLNRSLNEMVFPNGGWNLDLFHVWLSDELPRHGVIWSCLFRLMVWHIWKNNNLFIFQDITWTTLETVNVTLNWAQ